MSRVMNASYKNSNESTVVVILRCIIMHAPLSISFHVSLYKDCAFQASMKNRGESRCVITV